MAINTEAYNTIKNNAAQKNATLVAVSKFKPLEDILALYDLGQRDFGENFVQELLLKYEALPKDIRWHYIGHLQTNKVKFIAPIVHLIHGVDSEKLLAEINKQAAKNNRVIDCLLQLHIAEEETKSYCAELINTIKQNDTNYQNNAFWHLLNNSILSYHQNKPTPETIEYMQTAFINPIKVAIISNFRHIPEAILIADNCRKATWLYSEIKMRSETLGKDFDRANTNMVKTIGDLRDLTKDMIA